MLLAFEVVGVLVCGLLLAAWPARIASRAKREYRHLAPIVPVNKYRMIPRDTKGFGFYSMDPQVVPPWKVEFSDDATDEDKELIRRFRQLEERADDFIMLAMIIVLLTASAMGFLMSWHLA